jgi:hypothetical protein
MSATDAQIRELAGAIAAQAQALADGAIPAGQRYAQVLKLEGNVDTLKHWTLDDREHTRLAPGQCRGCGETFAGERGLKAHQTGRFVAQGCRSDEVKAKWAESTALRQAQIDAKKQKP